MENAPNIEPHKHEQVEWENVTKQKEFLFEQFIETKLFYSFSKELERFGYNDEQMHAFYEIFDTLSHANKLSLLAFPWELKQRAFPAFKEKIEAGEIKMDEMIEKIIKASKTQARHIAYHCSDHDITPKEENDGQGKRVKTWAIKGTEPDHRDNDVPMAYYSFDYHHLYKTKSPEFIYVVSIQTNEKSGHKKDNNRVWGRAPSLTVIEKINIEELEQYIADQEEKHRTENKEAA